MKMSDDLYGIYQRLHEWEKEALLQASVSFDKSIITLSSALLGFVFAIVQKITTYIIKHYHKNINYKFDYYYQIFNFMLFY